MTSLFAFAIGIAGPQTPSDARSGTATDALDFFFPAPLLHPPEALAEAAKDLVEGVQEITPATAAALNQNTGLALAPAAMLSGDQPLIAVKLAADTPIQSGAEAYLKLHLLSHRLCLPNSLNLANIFAHLPNVAWTSDGPIRVEELADWQLKARLEGRGLEVFAVDKFPKMVNYVVPAGVRIADASRIRLGAYLGDGTTVMHEGFVNFNAGTVGPNMVEGRVSQGVVLGAGTDLGGSASTMGTLSGGGSLIISIGQNCLIGANAGTGIPLGDRCTIEAGLYITAGTKVSVRDETGAAVSQIKARELAGQNDMLFIRDSSNGQVICRTNRKAIELNDALHSHN